MARPRRWCIQGARLTATTEAREDLPGAQARLSLPLGPRGFFSVLLAAFVVIALIHGGAHAFAQTTLNGFTSGAYFALGAVGLTFIYGSLRLINFAHGDFLTFGAYMGFLANVSLHLPLAAAALFAVATTAALGVTTERVMWRPMRSRRAGTFQVILMAVGLAFVLRYGIQFVAGPQLRALHVDATTSFKLPWGLTFGRTALFVAIASYLVLAGIGAMLRFSNLGKQMRALSDDLTLAETTGIDTERIILVIWLFAGGLAGLAGVLYACAIGSFDPNFGFVLILTLFASVVLGGIGSPYGALAGGVILGLVQEWSTLVIGPQWKIVVGFSVLMLVLLVRPEGVLARPRSL
jgi:neutral amino acid transport system permease protein